MQINCQFFKCSLKAEAKIWFQSVASSGLGDTSTYEALITKLKINFAPVRDKAALPRGLYGKTMSFYDKLPIFLLRKLELVTLLELNLSYARIMEIVTSLFTVVLQDFLDMEQVISMNTLFVTLRAYE